MKEGSTYVPHKQSHSSDRRALSGLSEGNAKLIAKFPHAHTGRRRRQWTGSANGQKRRMKGGERIELIDATIGR